MSTRWLGISVLVFGLATPAAAFHTVFDFTIDRFEADGNTFGTADGVPDLVDDFNGSLANWYTPYGTSSVSGGRLHVQSPGEHLPGPDGLALDLTEVASSGSLQKGYGNFTATAIFDPVIPPDQHFYHFTIYTYGGGTYFNELFGIDIHTIDGATIVEQHLVELDISHGVYQTLETESQVITAADLTGQIYFRLAYDDTAGTIVSSFSLDGGVTFHSPFSPAVILTQGRNLAQYILGADPRLPKANASTTTTITTPSTTTTTLAPSPCARTLCNAAGKSRLEVRGRRSGQLLRWAWLQGEAVSRDELGNPLSGDTAYAVCLRDDTGAPVYEGDLAPGKGWKATRSGFKHSGRNVSLLVNSGSAGSSRVLLDVKRLDPPVTLPVTVRVEADTGACWSATYVPSDVRRSGDQHMVAVQRVRFRPR